jgi:hypothetical protein
MDSCKSCFTKYACRKPAKSGKATCICIHFLVKVDTRVQTQVYLPVRCTCHTLLLFITTSIMKIFNDTIAGITLYTICIHYTCITAHIISLTYSLYNITVTWKTVHYVHTSHASTCTCWFSYSRQGLFKLCGWLCCQSWSDYHESDQ